MSFSPSNSTKGAENNLSSVASTAATKQAPMLNLAGGDALNTGAGNVTAGTNFFNTLLSGNRANTTAMLQPNINDITASNANTLKAINTLTPRGGGRSGALFGQSFAPTSQINNLFGPARTTAAQTLPQIGLAQGGLGANLFGLGNQALGIGSGAYSNLTSATQADRAQSNQLAAGLGGGLFKLATTPFGGGAAANGLLGLI